MVDKVKQGRYNRRHITTKEGNKMVTLNIGLEVSEHGSVAPMVGRTDDGTLCLHGVHHLLCATIGANNFSTRVAQGTELTLVVSVPTVMVTPSTVDGLSRLLGQDCIAVYYNKPELGTVLGALYGARAEQWGEFNAEYFIEWESVE